MGGDATLFRTGPAPQRRLYGCWLRKWFAPGDSHCLGGGSWIFAAAARRRFHTRTCGVGSKAVPGSSEVVHYRQRFRLDTVTAIRFCANEPRIRSPDGLD